MNCCEVRLREFPALHGDVAGFTAILVSAWGLLLRGRVSQGIAPFPWDEEQTEMALCGNTCAAASNGVCDEGRLDSYAAVLP